jgi:hypothetical protein
MDARPDISEGIAAVRTREQTEASSNASVPKLAMTIYTYPARTLSGTW